MTFESDVSFNGAANIPGSLLVYVYRPLCNGSSHIIGYHGYLVIPSYYSDYQTISYVEYTNITLFNNQTFFVIDFFVNFGINDVVRGIDNCVVNSLKKYNRGEVRNTTLTFIKTQIVHMMEAIRDNLDTIVSNSSAEE